MKTDFMYIMKIFFLLLLSIFNYLTLICNLKVDLVQSDSLNTVEYILLTQLHIHLNSSCFERGESAVSKYLKYYTEISKICEWRKCDMARRIWPQWSCCPGEIRHSPGRI